LLSNSVVPDPIFSNRRIVRVPLLNRGRELIFHRFFLKALKEVNRARRKRLAVLHALEDLNLTCLSVREMKRNDSSVPARASSNSFN
jgi:hypothetical protein